MTSPSTRLPEPEFLQTWRAACVAYRRARREGKKDDPAFREALAAFKALRPGMDDKEASAEVGCAISYASTRHAGWFWSGVGEGR
jgi:hypothetical protein